MFLLNKMSAVKKIQLGKATLYTINFLGFTEGSYKYPK